MPPRVGTLCCRGDKGKEATDVGDQAYLAQAEQMYQRSAAAAAEAAAGRTAAEAPATRRLLAVAGGMQALAGAPQEEQRLAAAAPLGRTIFLSTEDSEVVEVFKVRVCVRACTACAFA